jgi:FkbM family methyltransferase
MTCDESTRMPDQENLFRSGLSANILRVADRTLECLQMYHRPFGIRGVVAMLSHRLCGWPKELAARGAGIKRPVHLRVRTSDISGYEEILLGQQYAFDLPFVPKIIVDAGANIGMASIYYAHEYPNARIIAVEPEASNFAMLTRNVKPYPNIVPVRAAIWNKDGEISVSAPSRTQSASNKVGFVVHEGDGARVRALTMQTLMNDAKIDTIDILKVDIEGAEKEAFESCNWMQNVRCLAIELHDRFKPGCSAAVNTATPDFLTTQKGEVTFCVRKSCVEPDDDWRRFSDTPRHSGFSLSK